MQGASALAEQYTRIVPLSVVYLYRKYIVQIFIYSAAKHNSFLASRYVEITLHHHNNSDPQLLYE